jgi:hypothetical protein
MDMLYVQRWTHIYYQTGTGGMHTLVGRREGDIRRSVAKRQRKRGRENQEKLA